MQEINKNIQWPSGIQVEERMHYYNDSLNYTEGLNKLLELHPKKCPNAFYKIRNWILAGGGEFSEFEDKVSEFVNNPKFRNLPDIKSLLMVWVCVKALEKKPTIDTWKHVRHLKNNSNEISFGISDGMVICSEKNTHTRKKFIKLSKKIIELLNSLELSSEFERTNKERENSLLGWQDQNRNEKLEAIWWNRVGSDTFEYGEERCIFRLLLTIDEDALLTLMCKLSNPSLLRSLLYTIGINTNFDLWKKLILLAPDAFSRDGNWIEDSILTPILLIISNREINQASNNISRFEATDDEVEQVKIDISTLCTEVVLVIKKREDVIPLFARWSTWLMRQLLSQGLSEAENIHSSAIVDYNLIDEIGKALKESEDVPSTLCDSVESWEHWVYLSVLSFHAKNNYIEAPELKSFQQEWHVNIDSWDKESEQSLSKYADIVLMFNKTIPGDAAYLLSYPITKQDEPSKEWVTLWNDSYYLREIVEFGFRSKDTSNKYRSQTKASDLVFFLFCMGVGILDQLAERFVGKENNSRLAYLHKQLYDAVLEMIAIDNSYNNEKWLQALRHLSVRRLIWEVNDKKGSLNIFFFDDKPTFSDYLKYVKCDDIDFLETLHMALINKVDIQLLNNMLLNLGVKLSGVVDTVKKLKSLRENKYNVDLNVFQPLINISK